MARIIEKRLITEDDPMFNEGVAVGGGWLTPGLIKGWSRCKKEQAAKEAAEKKARQDKQDEENGNSTGGAA